MKPSPVVGLFVTCAVDLFRPAIGHASIKLLEDAGCHVVVPQQSCCGQISYNNGLPEDTRKLAEKNITIFQSCDYIVVPSGSCASMLKNHYPQLFKEHSSTVDVLGFSEKIHELTCFLQDILKVTPLPPAVTPSTEEVVAYHDSCAGLRELAIDQQPRKLAQQYRGTNMVNLDNGETCCGFGGTFCVKFPEISNQMVTSKAQSIDKSGADILLGGDVTCLLNIAGKLQRRGNNTIQVRHIAEYLAGFDDEPAIGHEDV